ncbi:hypothetical protein TA3x_001974 [Tundrisphaera sp. TA3]|uniref:hypothetical protein n=1 Tax=Tundrisphaera sp. TA3 TaxID=3435775 RepID=UPI003EBEE2D4
MKRTLAAVILLAALGVLFKLALKEGAPSGPRVPAPVGKVSPRAIDHEAELLARYPNDQALVRRVYEAYRQNALAVEATDGLRGLTMLDALGVEAIYLYESHPNDFRRLRDALTDASAADILLHWRDYFGMKRADDTDRKTVIAEIARLSPSQRRVAAKYPNALALFLSDPVGVTELVERWSGDPEDLADALALLSFISLETGSADLRAALRTLDEHGPLALDAYRTQGLDGVALVKLYGSILDAVGDALPLDQALILLRVNADYVDELMLSHPVETIAGHLRHIAAAGLVDEVGGNPDALRLVVEFGERGERALTQAGPDAADVVFEDFSDATLRVQAVEALAEHGPMALAMLDKYAADSGFREILRAHGAAVIPPIARADSAPEALALLKSKPRWTWSERLAKHVLALSGDNGQATIRLIQKDGLARVAELESTEVQFQQFLPLYDMVHLANVAARGQSPTSGEMAWALIDGCFVVLDALSLAAVQPEGVVAAEAARSELRSVVKQATRAAGREAVEDATSDIAKLAARRGVAEGAEATSARLARWWAVRAAGGTYTVLRQFPEALPKLSIPEIADLGRALCAKANLRLSTWGPLRILEQAGQLASSVPPGRGLKYVAVQFGQATVGVIGIRKMEEHLSSRRPQPPPG